MFIKCWGFSRIFFAWKRSLWYNYLNWRKKSDIEDNILISYYLSSVHIYTYAYIFCCEILWYWHNSNHPLINLSFQIITVLHCLAMCKTSPFVSIIQASQYRPSCFLSLRNCHIEIKILLPSLKSTVQYMFVQLKKNDKKHGIDVLWSGGGN